MEAIEAIELSVIYYKIKKRFYIGYSFQYRFFGILIDFNRTYKGREIFKIRFKIVARKAIIIAFSLSLFQFWATYAQKRKKKSINALKNAYKNRQLNNNSNVTKAQINACKYLYPI